ncbi:phosphoglycolate phosphatase [Candidatus Persebacteraceae bacterium Df01]|jgi:phosphoglycolate phosphatase|uniref:phosphoglycolate phosphatase n=1 Tax=Candidatus Doriopsillibacter californiensis TaxID=2970740 RepID=A0ABT7QJC1_9GAMM|nr:phosphoglycolate phosphatase [Candidatus Persebacteraceae bacterium Df01]
MTKALLFDLDGTLIDSAPDIHAAAIGTLNDLQLPPVPLSEAKQYIGDGMERFVKRILTRQWWGEPATDLLTHAKVRMNIHYERECTVRRLIYDGVKETLTTLQAAGIALGCVTNKPLRFTQPVLAACGLDVFFSAVVAGDSLPVKKPAPEPLQEACHLLNVDCHDTWMVGDSVADARAATAAGCHFAVVSYGYHRNGHLPDADTVIKFFPEVINLINFQYSTEKKTSHAGC